MTRVGRLAFPANHIGDRDEIEGTDIDYLPVLDQQGNGVMKEAYDDNCESGVLHIMRARRANGRAYVNPAWIPTWLDLGWRPA